MKTFTTFSVGAFLIHFVSGQSACNTECPSSFGLFPVPGDCGSFYNCDHCRPFKQPCAPGTLFDPKLGNCNFPHLVDCSSQGNAGTSSQVHSSHDSLVHHQSHDGHSSSVQISEKSPDSPVGHEHGGKSESYRPDERFGYTPNDGTHHQQVVSERQLLNNPYHYIGGSAAQSAQSEEQKMRLRAAWNEAQTLNRAQWSGRHQASGIDSTDQRQNSEQAFTDDGNSPRRYGTLPENTGAYSGHANFGRSGSYSSQSNSGRFISQNGQTQDSQDQTRLQAGNAQYESGAVDGNRGVSGTQIHQGSALQRKGAATERAQSGYVAAQVGETDPGASHTRYDGSYGGASGAQKGPRTRFEPQTVTAGEEASRGQQVRYGGQFPQGSYLVQNQDGTYRLVSQGAQNAAPGTRSGVPQRNGQSGTELRPLSGSGSYLVQNPDGTYSLLNGTAQNAAPGTRNGVPQRTGQSGAEVSPLSGPGGYGGQYSQQADRLQNQTDQDISVGIQSGGYAGQNVGLNYNGQNTDQQKTRSFNEVRVPGRSLPAQIGAGQAQRNRANSVQIGQSQRQNSAERSNSRQGVPADGVFRDSNPKDIVVVSAKSRFNHSHIDHHPESHPYLETHQIVYDHPHSAHHDLRISGNSTQNSVSGHHGHANSTETTENPNLKEGKSSGFVPAYYPVNITDENVSSSEKTRPYVQTSLRTQTDTNDTAADETSRENPRRIYLEEIELEKESPSAITEEDIRRIIFNQHAQQTGSRQNESVADASPKYHATSEKSSMKDANGTPMTYMEVQRIPQKPAGNTGIPPSERPIDYGRATDGSPQYDTYRRVDYSDQESVAESQQKAVIVEPLPKAESLVSSNQEKPVYRLGFQFDKDPLVKPVSP